MAAHYPESITFGTLSTGETLYAERTLGGSEPVYKLFRLVGSNSYEVARGSLSNLTHMAQEQLKRDKEQRERKIERQIELDNRALRLQQIIFRPKLEKPLKLKKAKPKRFLWGALIFIAIMAALLLRTYLRQ